LVHVGEVGSNWGWYLLGLVRVGCIRYQKVISGVGARTRATFSVRIRAPSPQPGLDVSRPELISARPRCFCVFVSFFVLLFVYAFSHAASFFAK